MVWYPRIKTIEKAVRGLDHSEKNEHWKAAVINRDKKCRRCENPNRLIALRIDDYENVVERNRLKTFDEIMNCPEIWYE